MKSTKKNQLIYLALDIRNSTDINKFLRDFYGEEGIYEFYSNFKKECDSIAVDKYNGKDTNETVDYFSYTWQDDNFEIAVKAGVALREKVPQAMRDYYSINVDFGIGITMGDAILEEDGKTVRSDVPRRAFALQENCKVIRTDRPVDRIKVDKNDYTSVKCLLTTKGEIINCHEVTKFNRTKEVRKHNTYRFLLRHSGIGQDCHSHLEGTHLNRRVLENLVEKSLKVFNEDQEKKEKFIEVTGIEPKALNKLLGELYNQDGKYDINLSFSFDEFLKKLYLAKLCLSSSEQNAYNYVKAAVRRETQKKPMSTIGISPSVPLDFPHLNKQKWTDLVIKAIKESVREPKQTTVILETLRYRLLDKSYLNSLEFLKQLKVAIPELNVAIGLSHDAEKYPLNTSLIQENYRDYLTKSLEIDASIQVHVHELEQVAKNKPLEEFNFLLDLFDELGIYGVSWIHMSYLNPAKGVVSEDQAISYLKRLENRQDRIIMNPTSNMLLVRENVLNNKAIIDFIIEKDMNITLGTDDSLAFGISDINDEYSRLREYLLENGFKYEVVRKLIKLAKTNSWKFFDKESKEWKRVDIVETENTMNLDMSVLDSVLEKAYC
jgi:hypothetical protein